jgi:hypothetical protein
LPLRRESGLASVGYGTVVAFQRQSARWDFHEENDSQRKVGPQNKSEIRLSGNHPRFLRLEKGCEVVTGFSLVTNIWSSTKLISSFTLHLGLLII